MSRCRAAPRHGTMPRDRGPSPSVPRGSEGVRAHLVTPVHHRGPGRRRLRLGDADGITGRRDAGPIERAVGDPRRDRVGRSGRRAQRGALDRATDRCPDGVHRRARRSGPAQRDGRGHVHDEGGRDRRQRRIPAGRPRLPPEARDRPGPDQALARVHDGARPAHHAGPRPRPALRSAGRQHDARVDPRCADGRHGPGRWLRGLPGRPAPRARRVDHHPARLPGGLHA